MRPLSHSTHGALAACRIYLNALEKTQLAHVNSPAHLMRAAMQRLTATPLPPSLQSWSRGAAPFKKIVFFPHYIKMYHFYIVV